MQPTPTLEEKLKRLIAEGVGAWDGRKLAPKVPKAELLGSKTANDLLPRLLETWKKHGVVPPNQGGVRTHPTVLVPPQNTGLFDPVTLRLPGREDLALRLARQQNCREAT